MFTIGNTSHIAAMYTVTCHVDTNYINIDNATVGFIILRCMNHPHPHFLDVSTSTNNEI